MSFATTLNNAFLFASTEENFHKNIGYWDAFSDTQAFIFNRKLGISFLAEHTREEGYTLKIQHRDRRTATKQRISDPQHINAKVSEILGIC